MALTPTLPAISLCNFPRLAKRFACASFFAISALDFFCLGIAVASTISPGRKDDLATLLLSCPRKCRLVQKQQLTGLFCERDAPNGRGGSSPTSRESKPVGTGISAS